ncbi:MAG: hypothetical protein Q4B30_07635 [Coriobacteriaceae bacterium]|nr:hypothetical protein [Coriobacteriaceae bacterium]
MASKTSRTKSVRLPNAIWDKLDWIAQNEGERVNDFIRAAVADRLEGYDVPDLTVVEGQQELF